MIERGARDRRRDDYVVAALLDRGALLDPIGQLRAVYPNTLTIERPLYEVGGPGGERRPRPGSAGDLELFEAFFDYATGEPLTAAQRNALAALIDRLERRRREAPS